ncbi:DinB family protein [Olivibacter sp. XZL3]|uniref:DinB family protein n=1 Tax=Olivibacter sp. XZL3 TaxID=1735116 RepID=UPI0010655294|nr:DinB family protein [Olivibacter sp. XZL3]
MTEMTKHFVGLLGYDKFSNLKLIELLKPEERFDESIGLMSHLLVAQQIWLKRCKGEPTVGGSLWPRWRLPDLHNTVLMNYEAWMLFLSSVEESDFMKPVTYQNSKGLSFTNSLEDVLTHLINHGTHHRAQIGQQLKAIGLTLPNTDYIFYVREESDKT